MAIFLAPNQSETPCYFQMQGTKLIRDMRASHWYSNYAHQNAFEVKKFNELSHLFCDAISEKEISGVKFVFRQATRIDQDRLFLLQFLAPVSHYQTFADAFGLGIASFDLTNGAPNLPVEPQTKFALDGFAFQMPQSWPQGGKSDENDLIDLINLNRENEMESWLRVQLVPSGDDRFILDRLSDQLKKSSIQLGDPISENHDLTMGKNSARLSAEFGATITGNEKIQEIRVSSFALDAESSIAVSMVCPSRTEDYIGWAVNQRGFEIACETLAPTVTATK